MAELLALFPRLDTHGGVQASGRLVRAALVGRSIEADAGSRRAAVGAALRAPRADQVLVWHMGMLKLLPFLRLPRQTRVALFLHGIEAWAAPGYLTRVLLRRVDLFLSNSEYTWRRFVARHPRYAAAPHRTVSLGLGVALDGPLPRPAGPPVALMLARLRRSEDYKGHRELIAAWPRVRRRMPTAELWIAGDGDLGPDLQRLVTENGLDDAVRFFGAVSEPEKERLLARSHCLALPSRAEGFGLVYVEAMRLGRPCLVSTLDAGREVVSPPEAGLAADPEQPDALAEAVCRLLEPGPDWLARSTAANARHARGFTAQHFQDRLRAALGPLSEGRVSDDVWHRRRSAA